MIRAGIIGLGRWGRTLVDSVAGSSEEIEFRSAFVRNRSESVTAYCRKRDLTLSESYEDLLADPDIDAVVIATPHSQHREQVLKACSAGKHVFVEKPLALDWRGSVEAAESAEKAGLTLAVGFVRRFHPSVAEIRNRLADGRLGQLCGLVGQQTSGTGPYLTAGNWRSDPSESPAAAMTATGVHLLDSMIEFAGEVGEVSCRLNACCRADENDTTAIMLSFRSGVTGMLFCSIATGPNFNLSVYGTRGHAEVSGTSLETFRFTPIPEKAPDGPVRAPEAEVIRSPDFSMVRVELLDFACSIKEKRPFAVPIADVLHGALVLDAIVSSSSLGRSVEVRRPC